MELLRVRLENDASATQRAAEAAEAERAELQVGTLRLGRRLLAPLLGTRKQLRPRLGSLLLSVQGWLSRCLITALSAAGLCRRLSEQKGPPGCLPASSSVVSAAVLLQTNKVELHWAARLLAYPIGAAAPVASLQVPAAGLCKEGVQQWTARLLACCYAASTSSLRLQAPAAGLCKIVGSPHI